MLCAHRRHLHEYLFGLADCVWADPFSSGLMSRANVCAQGKPVQYLHSLVQTVNVNFYIKMAHLPRPSLSGVFLVAISVVKLDKQELDFNYTSKNSVSHKVKNPELYLGILFHFCMWQVAISHILSAVLKSRINSIN